MAFWVLAPVDKHHGDLPSGVQNESLLNLMG